MKKQLIFEQCEAIDRTLALWLEQGTLTGVSFWEGNEPAFDANELKASVPDYELTEFVLKFLKEEQREAMLLPHPDYEETVEAISRAITAFKAEEERKGGLISFRIPENQMRHVRDALQAYYEILKHKEGHIESVFRHDVAALQEAFAYMAEIVLTAGEYEEWSEESPSTIPVFMFNRKTK